MTILQEDFHYHTFQKRFQAINWTQITQLGSKKQRWDLNPCQSDEGERGVKKQFKTQHSKN